MDLSPHDRETARDKTRQAWRTLHPDAGEAEVPEALRASEPHPAETPTRPSFATFTAKLRELLGLAASIADEEPREFAEGHGGLLVALWLPPSAAAQLALPGGEPAESLHVTLCYCGDVADLDELTLARAIAAVDRAVSYRAPLEGQVAGYGRFNASPTSDARDVFYAAVDVPELAHLRECIANELTWAGCPPRATHGYTPHVTLAYLDPEAPNPVTDLPSLSLRFGTVTVMVGQRRIDIPLGGLGPMIYSAASSGLAAVPPGFVAAVRPLLFALDQEWIAYLPAPGTYFHTLYGAIDLTPERLSRIVENHNGNVYGQDIPINCEHDGRAAGAVGWIKPGNMRLAGDGSIEVRPEWNERGRTLLEGDRFRYVSAEFAYDWQDPVTGVWHQDVAQGLAICTRPHFKTDVLKSLAASEEAAIALVRFGTAGDRGTGTKEAPVSEKTVQLTEEEVQRFRELETREAEREQAFTELKAAKEATDQKVARLETDAQSKRFTDVVMGRGDAGDGAVWPGEIKESVADLTRFAEVYGEDSDEFRAHVAHMQGIAKTLKESALFRPIGTSESDEGASAWDRIQTKAQTYAEEHKVTPEQAIAAVAAAEPELYREYRRGQ